MVNLTDTIRQEYDPFVEYYQTPTVLEILYENDESFKASVDKFIESIGKAEALIGQEVVGRYGGFYGLHVLLTLHSYLEVPVTL